MDAPRRCDSCGAELGADADSDDLCPRCLMKLALPEGRPEPSETDDAGFSGTERPSQSSTQVIGAYRLLRRIGEGGMGEVWEADQRAPVRRKVALKLIKVGMDTKQVVARFESERQALALMNHQNIAKVFDAGATEQGRPFFVMEYVSGVPITEYCDTQRLSTSDRLSLFTQVCEGVQHAHQKGIIHRDIKPSNVLVQLQDGNPVPKIIDFGVAKATAQRLTEKTLFTQLGVLVGTPAYMSPEQAELTGLDVDTRTDVYSLGVLLYEMLVGALPFDARKLREAGFDEIRRVIREEQPSKPSARITTLGEACRQSAAHRRTDTVALARELRGDLDWIAMRALEKDRTRRYGSPSDLAADIRRHLSHEPVLAGPPSVAYRARKFVRRHRIGVGAAAVVLAALVVGLAAATYGLFEARRANERTREEASTAGRVTEFLVGLFEVSDPNEARGNTITAREVLDRGAEQIDTGLEDQPRVRQRLRHTMGRVYRNLGLYDEATRLLEQALNEQRELSDDPDASTLNTMIDLANVYVLEGRERDAEQLYGEAFDLGDRGLGRHHETTLRAMALLGNLYRIEGRYEEAESLLVEALEAYREVLGDEHEMTHATMANLAMLYTGQRRYEEAEALYLEAIELARRNLGEDHPETWDEMLGLVWLYVNQARYDEAEPLAVEALAAQRRIRGADDSDTLRWMGMLGELYRLQGRYDDAEPLLVEAREVARDRLGDDHAISLDTAISLAELHRDQGRYAEAETLARESLARYRRVAGEGHPVILWAVRVLADIYRLQGRDDAARPLLAELLEARRDAAEKPDAGPEDKNRYAWPLLTWEPADLRDPETALGFALEANELSGYEDPKYLNTLALAYHLTGDAIRAVGTQRKALSLLPEGDRRYERFRERLAEFEAQEPEGE